MRKSICLAIMIVSMLMTTAYAAKWSSLNIPMKEGRDAMIAQSYEPDRMKVLTSYDRNKLYGIYFWRHEFYSRPEDGEGQINYRIYLSFLDMKKKPWVIYDSLLYTRVWFNSSITESNPHWVNRGKVTADNPDNEKIAKQVVAQANKLVKQDRITGRNVPIDLKTVKVPDDMK